MSGSHVGDLYLFIRQLDSWFGGGADGAVAETEAWDGPSGARFAGGGMLGSLSLPRLAGLAASAAAAAAASGPFRFFRT